MTTTYLGAFGVYRPTIGRRWVSDDFGPRSPIPRVSVGKLWRRSVSSHVYRRLRKLGFSPEAGSIGIIGGATVLINIYHQVTPRPNPLGPDAGCLFYGLAVLLWDSAVYQGVKATTEKRARSR